MMRRTLIVFLSLSSTVGVSCSPARDSPDQTDFDVGRPLAGGDTAIGMPLVSNVDSIIELATEVYRRDEYDSAKALLNPTLRRARAEYDSVSEARIVTLLGLTAYRESDYVLARELGAASLELKFLIGLESEVNRSYNLLGLVAWKEARRSDALELFDKSLEFTSEAEYDRALAVASNNKGLIFTDLGMFDEARALFATSLNVAMSIEDTRLVGYANLNTGMLEIWTGNPSTAISYLESAVSQFDSADIELGKINALGQLGTVHTANGEIAKAMAVLDTAIAFARGRKMLDEEASSTEALAEVHRLAGDYRRALALYAEAEGLNGEMGLVEETGADQRSRAEIYATQGDLNLALAFARRALATHQSVDARWELFADHVLLADLEHRSGKQTESAAHLRTARQLAAEFDARTARIEVALTEARIAERDGDARRVLRAIEAVRSDLLAGGYDAEWEAEVLRARAFAVLGQLDSATAAADSSVAAVERVRSSAGSGLLRTSYATKRLEAYTALVSALLDQGDTKRAFEVTDISRGRALLEHVMARQLVEDGTRSDPNARESERLLRMIGKISAELREFELSPPPDWDSVDIELSILDSRERLARARSDYEALLARSAEAPPMGDVLLGGSSVDVKQIIAALQRDEALLQYFATSDELVGFVATRSGVETFVSPISSEVLTRRVRMARDFMGSLETDSSAGRAVMRSLYEVLLSPALSRGYLDGVESLAIVPHGVLTYLPFDALIDSASGRYLVADYRIQVLPSASALPYLRERVALDGEGLLGDNGDVAFAPLPRELPATRTEARAFGKAVRGGQVLTGDKATERRLREALSRSGIVHVASHATMNVRNPLFSRIQLFPGSGNPNDDGRLEVHELLDMSIASRLVFLSGCETGVGTAWSTEFAHGEDYATLGLAFLYAGARNVVATLWPVEDEGAAAFAESFYKFLSDFPAVEALARAKREMMMHGRYSAPYYWAAYQIVGSGVNESTAQLSGR